MAAERPSAGFSTVVLDVDSTLAGVEGIDWLAGLRDAETLAYVRTLTEAAMNGGLALEDAYGRRLERVAPTHAEVQALAGVYREEIAAGARDAVVRLRGAGVRVVAMSGGLREAILPLCRDATIEDRDVYAVAASWDARGAYAGFDRSSPLVTRGGKAVLLRELAPPRPVLAVGDGSTDLAMRTAGAADAFAAFTGFVRRVSVIDAADYTIDTFGDLVSLVMPQ